MVTHALVPVDSSENAGEILQFALDNFTAAKVTLLHAINPTDQWIYPTEEKFESLVAEREEFIEELIEEVDFEDRNITTTIRRGDPREQILDFVDNNEVDCVVLGSRGTGGPEMILLGSVASTVARRSPVTVVIVR